MKKILTAFLLVTATTFMFIADADAARLGGGRSFGRQSPAAARQAPVQRQAAPQTAQSPGAAAPRPSPWRGLLGGALLGLGLGALLGHLGIGAGMASIIGTVLTFALIFFAIRFVLNMFARKKQAEAHVTAYSGSTGGNFGGNNGGVFGGFPGGQSGSSTPAIGSGLQQAASAEYQPYGVPGDFDVPAFLRSAKTHFIRLQASWDRADIDDIREFTSPEMFAELRMQLQERGASPNVTDVVTIDAALLGIETINNQQMASVRFTGTLREGANAPAEPIDEIWNLVRPLSSSGGWVLAGIQQTA
ncbi:MAG: Tim44 domain-containing protein [Oxalobacter sp.]|nr:MAG: Tim44 domain-containing protein [Oxalobacter sp.]